MTCVDHVNWFVAVNPEGIVVREEHVADADVAIVEDDAGITMLALP